MKSILLSLFSRKTPEGKTSPKSYPFYKELTKSLNDMGFLTIQLGVVEESDIGAIHRYNGLPAEDLVKIVKDSYTFISCDTFLPHLCQCYCPEKRGIVIWSKSDPAVFGYPNNINLRTIFGRNNLNIGMGYYAKNLLLLFRM